MNDFSAIPLSKLRPDEALPVDIYLRIDDKPILYRKQGDVIDQVRYHQFISKHVTSIYIHHNDAKTFLEWLDQKKDEAINQQVKIVGEEYRELANKREEIREHLFVTFAEEPLSTEKIKILYQQTSELVVMASKNKKSAMALARLIRFDRSLAEHSLNVANLSVFLAMTLGHGDQYFLEQLYLAGIFHDYGKTQLPPEVMADSTKMEFNRVVSTHPELGHRLLKKEQGTEISNIVLDVVIEHHENQNGTGHPKRLLGNEIHLHSKIVTIANLFDNEVSSDKTIPESERLAKGFNLLAFDHGKHFDPKLLERTFEALQIAFSERLWKS